MKHYITVFYGNEKVQTVLLNSLPAFGLGRITVGRQETNDIVISYPSVSRNHAVIEIRGDIVDIVDAGSLNKLRVNGKAYERIRLADGLKVTIGTSVNTVALVYNAVAEQMPVSGGAAGNSDNAAVFGINDANPPAAKRVLEVVEPVSTPPAADGYSGAADPQINQNKKPDKKIKSAYMGRRIFASMADFVICMFMVIGAAFLMMLALNKQFSIKLIALFTFFVAVLVSWVYNTLGESGNAKGTLGKMALGLKVVDAKTGGRISAKTATKRYFAKILSCLILFIGFIPIFGKKQTFHDYLCGTRVEKNN